MSDEAECNRLLDSLNAACLIRWYNDMAEHLGDNKVKRFESRAVGVARSLKLMARCGFLPEDSAALAALAKKQRGSFRGATFRYPPSGEAKTSREGTLRASIQDMLKRGATFAEITQFLRFRDLSKGLEPVNVEDRAYRRIREAHLELGWGLREEERPGVGKVIFIFDKSPACAYGARAHAA